MPLNIPNYHQSTETLHVGCEKPRAYFVPFPCGCASKHAERGESAFIEEAEYHERTKELVSRTESKIPAIDREEAL